MAGRRVGHWAASMGSSKAVVKALKKAARSVVPLAGNLAHYSAASMAYLKAEQKVTRKAV